MPKGLFYIYIDKQAVVDGSPGKKRQPSSVDNKDVNTVELSVRLV